jgi:hypothetical protein
MTNEERERIRAEARATIERLQDFPRRENYEQQESRRDHGRDMPLEFEDATTKWRRQAEEKERAVVAERERLQRQEREVQAQCWNDFWGEIDRRIETALAEQRRTLIDIFKEGIDGVGTLAEAVERRLIDMDTKLIKLGTCLAEARSHSSSSSREPVDLPSPLLRRTTTSMN